MDLTLSAPKCYLGANCKKGPPRAGFFFITEIYHRAEIYHRNVHNGALLRALEARDANGARRARTASKLCLRDSVIS